MAELKTKLTDKDPKEFIEETVEHAKKKEDSYQFLDFFTRTTGFQPKIWGTSIIGYGQYHYKSERSRQEGDWPIIGFSPRKTAFSLYVFSGSPKHEHLLENLGKLTKGKACIYVKKFEDVNLDVLENLTKETIKYYQEKYPTN